MDKTAQDLASKGRYGDTMLVHMNPKEVAGLASLAPGEMTVNPETGLPEAFSFTKLFDRIAPIAIPLAVGAATGGLGTAAGAAGTGAGTGFFSNPIVRRALFSGATNFALSKMRGADTSDALNAGLTSGLVYGAGAKLMGVGAQPGIDETNQTAIGLQNAAGADGITADPITQMDIDNTIKPNITTASYQNYASLKPTTEFDPSYAYEKDLVSPTDRTGLQMGDSISKVGFQPQGELTIDDPLSRGEVERVDIDNKGYGAASDRDYVLRERQEPSGGISGYLKSVAPRSLGDTALMAGATYAGQAMLPSEEEERKRKQIVRTDPYRRNVSFPDEYRGREYRYFQEGGVVNPTSPVEDTPEGMGLSYYAPLIAGYGANTSLPPMAATMPAGNYTTPTAPMGGGIASGSSIEKVYAPSAPAEDTEVTDAELLADVRKLRAPKGYMWSANTPNIAPGIRGNTTYKLFPTMNLSGLEMKDLTSRGILTQYRPQGSQFSDYKPKVSKKMQEGGITSLPQTAGQVEGRGDGMDDEVFGDIEGQQEVALSKDEFIVPADVVAGLGNGSSNAGASQLYEMMDRVRVARTGKKTQPPEIEAREFLPA